MRALKGLVRFVVLTALLVGVALAIKYAIGKHDGEPCSNSLDCARFTGAQCLQDPGGRRYCTHHCKLDGDCPDGWSCTRAMGLNTFSTGEESLCMAPAADAGAPSSSAHGAAGHNARH